MELERRQWFVRWFFWSLGIWNEFTERDDSWRMKRRGTNLCHFIRVTSVWAPLVLLLHLAVYGAAISALTLVPIALFGFTFYISLIVAIATVVLVVWASKRYMAYQRSRAAHKAYTATSTAAPATEAKPVEKAPPAPRPPGFFETLWAYIVAIKRKVCPMISFREPEGRVA
jgi:hypothetical protein